MTFENWEQYAEAALVVCSVITTFIGFLIGKKRATKIETGVREGLEENLPELLEDYERQKRRAQEYLEKIEGILTERDGWRDLYNDQAAGHDNAQALMMNTIHNLVRAYQKATGKTPKLDPIIEAVRNDFVGKHGGKKETLPAVEETAGKAEEAPHETSE